MRDSPCEVPLTEQLLSIPANYKTAHAIQWAEDGRETGHQFIPVGYMMHRAANRILDLERQLSDALEREAKLRQELAIEFGNSDRLAKALQIAIRQNSHDMLMTGEELRKCESALALHESGDEPTYTDCPIHGRHEGDCPRC